MFLITRYLLLLCSCLLSTVTASAQDTIRNPSSFTFSAFADIYFAYDLNQPKDQLRPFFLYNHNRHNEFNLNLGMIRAAYENKNVRANLGLMAGTYAQYNLSSEPTLLQNVYEANIGTKLSATSNLWVDAGIMPSHIGFESAISTDNWTLTRGLAAENSPYFETGAKISYTTKNEKLFLSGMILNGWQRIQRPVANNTPAFGTQVTIKPNEKTTLNWSTFIGNDKPDSARQWRYFNDFYGIFQLSEKWGVTAGFDVGLEQKAKGSSQLNAWYAPTIIVRFVPVDAWAFAARAEYFSDKDQVINTTNTPGGFRVFGASINADRKLNDKIWWRTGLRMLTAKDAIFEKNGSNVKNNTAITTSLAISL